MAKNQRKLKHKYHLTLKFNDAESLKEAFKAIEKKMVLNFPAKVSDIGQKYLVHGYKEEKQDLTDIIDYRFERQVIDGKEKVVLILPSRMNEL